jgi:AraC-like DNA-binding protein
MFYGLLASAPMFVCAFWAMTLFFDRNNQTRARRMLTFFMVVATIHFLGQAIFCYHDYRLTALYDPVYSLATGLVFPLFYLYIQTLTHPRKLTLKSLWMIAPSAIVFLLYLILYAPMSPEEMELFCRYRLYREPVDTAGLTGWIQMQSWNVTLLAVIFAVQIPFVAWFGTQQIIQYRKQLSEFYSNPDEKLIAPTKTLLYFFIVTSIASFAFNATGRLFFVSSTGWLLVASISFVTMLYALGFAGFRQYFSIDEMTKDEERNDSVENAVEISKTDNATPLKKLEERLLNLLEQEELFLNPDLCIADIARKLGTNRTYISRVVNQNRQLSFSDFINTYRVEYAKKLMNENPDIKRTDLAEMSGFGSVLSMKRAFDVKKKERC